MVKGKMDRRKGSEELQDETKENPGGEVEQTEGREPCIFEPESQSTGEEEVFPGTEVLKTGEREPVRVKRRIMRFGKFEVVLELDENDEVIRVLEININKEFLEREKRISIIPSEDVDDYYKDG